MESITNLFLFKINKIKLIIKKKFTILPPHKYFDIKRSFQQAMKLSKSLIFFTQIMTDLSEKSNKFRK